MSLLLKWMFLGVSAAVLNELKRTRETPNRFKQQAAGVVRKGVVAIAGLMVASTVLSAGVIIAINNWFVAYQNTGSSSMPASVWGGVVLAIIGGVILSLAWPRSNFQKAEEPRRSELQEAIAMALRGYIDEKQQQKEIRKNKTFIRSVS